MNPRAATNDLLPFQGSPFSQLGYFSKNGEGGIRTHAPFRTNGFQDRLVMTTSIPLHIYNSENQLFELPLCNVHYNITGIFSMSSLILYFLYPLYILILFQKNPPITDKALSSNHSQLLLSNHWKRQKAHSGIVSGRHCQKETLCPKQAPLFSYLIMIQLLFCCIL